MLGKNIYTFKFNQGRCYIPLRNKGYLASIPTQDTTMLGECRGCVLMEYYLKQTLPCSERLTLDIGFTRARWKELLILVDKCSRHLNINPWMSSIMHGTSQITKSLVLYSPNYLDINNSTITLVSRNDATCICCQFACNQLLYYWSINHMLRNLLVFQRKKIVSWQIILVVL